VYIVIALMILLTIAAAAFYVAPRVAEGRVIYENEPDQPLAFGRSMAWLAVRSRDPERVVEVLGLANVQAANWNTGLGAVHDEDLGESHIFVSPPVNGWVFVAGLGLPMPMGRRFVDKSTPLLLDLGRHFSEVQYFFGYPMIDYFAWSRMIEGRLVRAFAIGDNGIVSNKGQPTKEERSLGLKLFELRGVRDRLGDAGGELVLHPTQAHVLRLARKWSLDPTTLSATDAAPALGWIGVAPLAWRTERMRKAAA
jgi:hypothetical protein